jgi:hypothetical protein
MFQIQQAGRKEAMSHFFLPNVHGDTLMGTIRLPCTQSKLYCHSHKWTSTDITPAKANLLLLASVT